MAKYRVKPGRKFGAGGKYPAGAVVELSKKDAEPFLDLLIPLADENKPVTPLKNELGVVIESDYSQTLVDPSELEEGGDDAEGLIDLAGGEAKKPRKKKSKAE